MIQKVFPLLLLFGLAAGLAYYHEGGVSMDADEMADQNADAQKDLYDEAKMLFLRSFYKDAFEKYKDAIDREPDHPKRVEADFDMAYCCEQLGRYTEAMIRFRGFANTYPDHQKAKRAERRASYLKANGA